MSVEKAKACYIFRRKRSKCVEQWIMNYPLLSERMKAGTVGFPEDVLAL